MIEFIVCALLLVLAIVIVTKSLDIEDEQQAEDCPRLIDDTTGWHEFVERMKP